jgi:hypothetical protein
MPDLVGSPILLASGNFHALQPPEQGPDDDPWPEFIRQVLLSPVPPDESELELLIDIDATLVPLTWSAKLLDKEGLPGETLLRVDTALEASRSSIRLPLSPETLTRLLTDQEIRICWSECPRGRAVPLNVDPSARLRLPISPGNHRIQETDLLSYYQGRVSWEDLFPDPDPPTGADKAPLPETPEAGVDKSRIQSYQIREFVEALTGLTQDLKAATQSEPSMRLALLGPVSPLALVQTVIDAVQLGSRTPVAAGFQLVEILACLKSARSFAAPERLAEAWQQHLQDAIDRITRMFKQLIVSHRGPLASNKAFDRYQKAVLSGGARLGG